MTRDEAIKIIEIIREVDSGCSACVSSAAEAFWRELLPPIPREEYAALVFTGESQFDKDMRADLLGQIRGQ